MCQTGVIGDAITVVCQRPSKHQSLRQSAILSTYRHKERPRADICGKQTAHCADRCSLPVFVYDYTFSTKMIAAHETQAVEAHILNED